MVPVSLLNFLGSPFAVSSLQISADCRRAVLSGVPLHEPASLGALCRPEVNELQPPGQTQPWPVSVNKALLATATPICLCFTNGCLPSAMAELSN